MPNPSDPFILKNESSFSVTTVKLIQRRFEFFCRGTTFSKGEGGVLSRDLVKALMSDTSRVHHIRFSGREEVLENIPSAVEVVVSVLQGSQVDRVARLSEELWERGNKTVWIVSEESRSFPIKGTRIIEVSTDNDKEIINRGKEVASEMEKLQRGRRYILLSLVALLMSLLVTVGVSGFLGWRVFAQTRLNSTFSAENSPFQHLHNPVSSSEVEIANNLEFVSFALAIVAVLSLLSLCIFSSGALPKMVADFMNVRTAAYFCTSVLTLASAVFVHGSSQNQFPQKWTVVVLGVVIAWQTVRVSLERLNFGNARTSISVAATLVLVFANFFWVFETLYVHLLFQQMYSSDQANVLAVAVLMGGAIYYHVESGSHYLSLLWGGGAWAESRLAISVANVWRSFGGVLRSPNAKSTERIHLAKLSKPRVWEWSVLIFSASCSLVVTLPMLIYGAPRSREVMIPFLVILNLVLLVVVHFGVRKTPLMSADIFEPEHVMEGKVLGLRSKISLSVYGCMLVAVIISAQARNIQGSDFSYWLAILSCISVAGDMTIFWRFSSESKNVLLVPIGCVGQAEKSWIMQLWLSPNIPAQAALLLAIVHFSFVFVPLMHLLSDILIVRMFAVCSFVFNLTSGARYLSLCGSLWEWVHRALPVSAESMHDFRPVLSANSSSSEDVTLLVGELR